MANESIKDFNRMLNEPMEPKDFVKDYEKFLAKL